MRHWLHKKLPDHQVIVANRWLKPFARSLLHPRLWHLNRRSAAGAVAAGLFCGLIPGPFQIPGAALCALIFRINLPLAIATTLYTNPLTIVPLYMVAYRIGSFITGENSQFILPPACEWRHAVQCCLELGDWLLLLGKPLGIGLITLAVLLAFSGYCLTKACWRIYLVHTWRKRQQRRSISR